MAPPITEIANPAAVGFRWKATDGDSQYELAWPRDTTYLLFAICTGDTWSSAFRMDRRWDLPEPTLSAARAKVAEFLTKEEV